MNEGKKPEGKKKLVSRRDFMVGSGAVIAAVALSACAPKAVTETVTSTVTAAGSTVTAPGSTVTAPGSTVTSTVTAPGSTVTNTATKTVTSTVTATSTTGVKEVTPLWYGQETPIPGIRKLGTTDYTCDVLVVVAGYAGTMAALRATALGQKVIVVNKGITGKAGLSPWANTMMFYDPTLGDTETNFIEGLQNRTQYLVDLDYLNLFMRDSLPRWKEWVQIGIANYTDTMPTPSELIQLSQGIITPGIDRRWFWPQVYKDKGIQVIERVMLTKLLTDSKGAVVGAAGLHCESDDVLIFRAKSVVLCCGAGTFKAGGFPGDQDTFDGDWMGYQVGAKIGGMEWNDFHGMGGVYPSDSWGQGDQRYLGRIYATTTPSYTRAGADMPPRNHEAVSIFQDGDLVTRDRGGIYPPNLTNTYNYEYVPVDRTLWENVRYDSDGYHPPLTWPEIPSRTNPQPSDNLSVGGGGTGLGVHCTEGIYPVDTNCWSGVPGLYAAGDALCSRLNGAVYGGKGISSSSAGVYGYIAGEQAAIYAQGTSAPVVSADEISSAQSEVLKPLQTTRGFSPQWISELVLQIYAPYYIAKMRDKARLEGALANCLFIRDHIADKIVAPDPHNNRLAHEARHMVFALEMKLRTALFREESRGYHYRQDFPFRDDKNWLAWLRCYKDMNGDMALEKVPVPDRMKTHSDYPYRARYAIAFVGEEEAIAARGIV